MSRRLGPLTMADKVGLRADVLYIEEQTRLVERLQANEHLEVLKVDDKREQLGVDKLGYIGIHLAVRPSDELAGCPLAISTCEIQARTRVQAAWAMASHELMYKAPSEPGVEIQRAMNRLSALVELFDQEVARAREAVVSGEVSLESLLEALESASSRFQSLSYDPALTHSVLDSLTIDATPDEIAELVEAVREIADRDEAFLRELFERYEGDARGTLLRQPESLLVLHLLRTQRHSLRSRWEEHLPTVYLEQLAAIFGVALPSLD